MRCRDVRANDVAEGGLIVESSGLREDGENDEKKTDQSPGCTNLTH